MQPLGPTGATEFHEFVRVVVGIFGALAYQPRYKTLFISGYQIRQNLYLGKEHIAAIITLKESGLINTTYVASITRPLQLACLPVWLA
jgi:hypothetical protein